MALVAQMVERKTLNLVVVGSSPTEGAFFLSRYTAKNFLNRNQKLKVQLWNETTTTTTAFVAQLAARGSHNPKVAGSIPVESICTPR